jgi:redox-sensitive bicupin YhaK (pirin superfamily)
LLGPSFPTRRSSDLGPFVMNTRAEIEQTLEDLRRGRFIRDEPRDA